MRSTAIAALAQIDQSLSNPTYFPTFQPTVFINLEHEAVYRKSLLGIFILSLGIISYNYINILASLGQLDRPSLESKKNVFPDKSAPVFSEFELYMMTGDKRTVYLEKFKIFMNFFGFSLDSKWNFGLTTIFVCLSIFTFLLVLISHVVIRKRGF